MIPHQRDSSEASSLTFKMILKSWLPLVASWMLMSIELPTINAIMARLSNPQINLAAYGGVVFPIALTIESPVIMLLAASTALSRDWLAYQRLKKITLWLGGILMGLHVLVALTPIYDFVVKVLLNAPAEVIEPARLGLLALSPWTFAIAYRRFQQGAMIRFNHSHMVGETTLVRLITVSTVLTIGMLTRSIPGTILAGLAQGLGVSSEAVYAGLRIRKILPDIKKAPPSKKPLTLKRFVSFYFPLALTSALWLLWQPLISASISRMQQPLDSLAVWSVITGLLFIFRSPGVAYNEAVVALLEKPSAFKVLRKFSLIISAATFVAGVLIAFTPFSDFWFTRVANLSDPMAQIAVTALSIGVPLTFITIFISFFQGIIVKLERTGAVAEAVLAFLIALIAILVIGVVTDEFVGVYVASTAYTLAHLAQAVWLLLRSRSARQTLLHEGFLEKVN